MNFCLDQTHQVREGRFRIFFFEMILRNESVVPAVYVGLAWQWETQSSNSKYFDDQIKDIHFAFKLNPLKYPQTIVYYPLL